MVEPKARGWPKGRKRYPKGVGAPTKPLSAYVHFLNERKESLKVENPDLKFTELSKKLAEEWAGLGEEEKEGYAEVARRDRSRYEQELKDYQKTDSYKEFMRAQEEGGGDSRPPAKRRKLSEGRGKKRQSSEESDQEETIHEPRSSDGNSFNIPILSQEFLEHNRAREHELRTLKKQTTMFEEQNAVLEKHIESMTSAVTRLQGEKEEQDHNIISLENQLDTLRNAVVSAFRGVELPGSMEPLTIDFADTFASKLLRIMKGPKDEDSPLKDTVREIVARMDFSKL